MTTDAPPGGSRITQRLSITPLGWRLGLVSVLAAAYVATWLALGSPRERSADPEPAPLPVVVTAPQPAPQVVWLDALPPSERPPLAVPAGWELASREVAPPRTATLSRPPRSIERAAPSRARVRRVRTRSS